MDSEAVIEFLGDVPVLQKFPISSIRRIAQLVVVKRYDSGEYIFREGERRDGIYFIWEGEVEVSGAFHADNHDFQVFQRRKFDCFTENEPVGEEDIVASTKPGGPRKSRSTFGWRLDLCTSNLPGPHLKLTLLMLPRKYSSLMQPTSIWSADMNLETRAPVEHILSLDPLDINTLRGITLKGAPKSSTVYGGQFMGQALAAASKTVHFRKILHSFHAHFLLGGDTNIPIIYQVDRLCDLPNLATRRVNAVQKERVVFFLIASFHGEEGYNHQEATMPSVPDPEKLLPEQGLEEGVKLNIRRIEVCTSTSVPWPTEIRPVDPVKYTRETTRDPSVMYWLRAKGRLPDDQALHRCVGAYFSDLLFIQISLNPHRRKGLSPSSISLDHSMWFHRDFRADDWLLYVIDSPTAYNARGFSRGQMFNRKGELVLSAMQVGVVRKTRFISSVASKI